MHDKKLAAQLVRDALLLEEKQREELLALLATPEVSEDFVGYVINVLGEEQKEFTQILTAMSDEEVSRLGMSVLQAEAEDVQKKSSQEAMRSSQDAESLLDSSLS